MNNLYGTTMSEKQPVDSSKWICDDELNNLENNPCFLEVDVECPESLQLP